MSYWAATAKIWRVVCFAWKHYEALHDILDSVKSVAKEPSKIDDLGAACDLIRGDGENTP